MGALLALAREWGPTAIIAVLAVSMYVKFINKAEKEDLAELEKKVEKTKNELQTNIDERVDEETCSGKRKEFHEEFKKVNDTISTQHTETQVALTEMKTDVKHMVRAVEKMNGGSH